MQQQVNKVKMFRKIFRTTSLNMPRLRIGKRVDKRATSVQYTSLESAQFKWKLVNSTAPEQDCECPDVTVDYPTDVTFVAPYVFVVADSEGHKLDIFDLTRAEGEQHCGSIAEGVVWPNSVAKLTSEEKVLVTDRRDRKVKTYDIETGVLTAEFGSPWNDEEIQYWPHGVTMTSKKEIVVTETSKHQVHVYDNKRGKLLNTFGQLGNKMENFCLPFYCAVDAADRILIADNLNYSVKIFSTKGRQVAYMGEGRQENRQKKLGSPYGVCSDFSGHVLVCDNSNNRIVQYDLATAEYEKDLVTKSSSVGLLSGSRKSTEVAIPEYKNEIMCRLNGCNSPCGIAVGPCGTMVYTEYTKQMSAIKAYTMYTVDIHTFV